MADWKDKLSSVGRGIWREVKDARSFMLQGEPVLMEDDSGVRPIDKDEASRKELTNNDIVHLYAIRIRAKDNHAPRRIVETWLSGSLLKRILIMSPYPTRKDARVSHDKYQIVMGYLLKRGIVVHYANGYRWADDMQSMNSRAEWLVATLKREGQMRVKNRNDGRYYIL